MHQGTAAWDEKTSVKLEILRNIPLNRVVIALSFHGNYTLLLVDECTRKKGFSKKKNIETLNG